MLCGTTYTNILINALAAPRGGLGRKARRGDEDRIRISARMPERCTANALANASGSFAKPRAKASRIQAAADA